MAKLGDMARIFIGNTEVSDAGEFNHEVLNDLLLQKGIDPDTGLPLAVDPETGLYVTSVAEVGEEMLERADEIIMAVSRALLPSFRELHPSIRYLVGKALFEENTERAVNLIAAYLSLTGNGSMPEYGMVAVYDERYDSREKAQNQDEARALEEWRKIKKAEELGRFETNLGREEGLEAEYPEEEYLSPRKERLEKQLTSKTIASYEQLVTDDGKEIAQWLASLSHEELDFFIGDSAPYLKNLSKALRRFGGKVVYADPKDPKSPVVSGLFRKIVDNTAFRSSCQSIPVDKAAEELADHWGIPSAFFQEEAFTTPEARKKRMEGWGVSMWYRANIFARAYDVSSKERVLADAALANDENAKATHRQAAKSYLDILNLDPQHISRAYGNGEPKDPTARDKAIAAVAIVHGKYTNVPQALAWGGFVSKDEAKQYLESLKLKPEKLEEIKGRVFGALSTAFTHRQELKNRVVNTALLFADEVWNAFTYRNGVSAEEKLVAALGVLHSPYLASRRTLGFNWGGFDNLDQARQYLATFPLPKADLEYLRKKVTYAIYEQAPKMPKETA